MACYCSRAAESGDPALRLASREQIHTSEGSKVQVKERNAMRACTRREARRTLMTRQSQIPSSPKSATNEFGSAVAVATCVPKRGVRPSPSNPPPLATPLTVICTDMVQMKRHPFNHVYYVLLLTSSRHTDMCNYGQ